ncbi:MAG: LLM class F420-dependent oxidoreductase [Thermomicrobiales bacterium]|nr:LLM class F420-dependent oxidoreductase [Thermomicrobiales bacterium]
MIEGQDGLNWGRWQRLAAAAEDFGFAGLYRSDHFTNPQGPHRDAIELWTSFTYLATNTKRIEFGPMVSPVSFRNPVVTAWTAAAIDDLSGGRLHLGLGAGWQEREHRSYGFELLDVGPRFQRFEEALRVVTQLLRSDEPTAFDGAFYHLEEALLLPRPARAGGPPIVIGGNGPKRTLPLAATFADEWNAVYVTAERFRELSGKLDRLVEAEGRATSDVRRTLMTRVVIGRTEAEAIAKIDGDVAALRERGVIVGDPSQVADALNALNEAGVQRVMAQWLDMDDIAGAELLASRVFPQLA